MAEIKTNLSTNMTANATITVDQKIVATVYAELSTSGGNDRVSQSIQTPELYNANKEAIREQIAAVQEEIYKIQDMIIRNEATIIPEVEK